MLEGKKKISFVNILQYNKKFVRTYSSIIVLLQKRKANKIN